MGAKRTYRAPGGFTGRTDEVAPRRDLTCSEESEWGVFRGRVSDLLKKSERDVKDVPTS